MAARPAMTLVDKKVRQVQGDEEDRPDIDQSVKHVRLMLSHDKQRD
jgi:hypothetical protein